MKIGVMSDIHGNPAALLDVLEDMDREGVDQIVCCGDVVGYGPDPVGVLELLRGREIPVVMGNHDAAVAGVIGSRDFIDDAQRGIRRHRGQLAPKDLHWLRNLPYLYEGKGFACAHGDFSCPEAFNYILQEQDAVPSLECRREPLLFVGHTHVSTAYAQVDGKILEMPNDALSFRVPENFRFVVNVGSVGYPRSEYCSSYATYDTEARVVAFHRIPFDFSGYLDQFRRRRIQLPGWLAQLLELAARSKE